MEKILAEKLREGSLNSIELQILFDSIREQPYNERMKEDSNFRAIVLQLENRGCITNKQAIIYRRQFYNPNYQLKI